MLNANSTPRRSKAWIYYTFIALALLLSIPSGGFSSAVGAVLSGLYAVYLYRGGRVVIWIW